MIYGTRKDKTDYRRFMREGLDEALIKVLKALGVKKKGGRVLKVPKPPKGAGLIKS